MTEQTTAVSLREISKPLMRFIEKFANALKNSKTLLWGISSLIILVAGIVAWRWLRPPMRIERTNVLASPALSHPNVSPSPRNPRDDTTRFQRPGGPYEASDPRWEIVRTKDKVDRNWEWRMPINFYGRVVDENGQPVPAAKVEFSWTDLSAAGTSKSEVLSDSTGAFSLEGKTGRILQVDVSRDGYYKAKGERLKSFDYAGFWEANYHEADRTRPVIFHLFKKGRGETLSGGEARPTVPADGTPIRIDLLNGAQISNTGQVEIAAQTNTERYPPRLFDWNASITIRDGGLVEHSLEFPFTAPEEGYVPKAEFKMSAVAPDWRRSIEKSYFIRFGTPARYGRIHIRINGASQKVALNYAVNPTGSRNLEPNTTEPFSSP